MKFNFYIVGKVKEPYMKQAMDLYAKRLAHYATFQIVFIEEASLPQEYKKAEVEKALEEEGERIIKSVKATDYKILLDLHGKSLSSEEFAKNLDLILTNGYSSISFIIGSSYGLSDKVREYSNYRLKVSDMTFTHPQTLLLILEQTYRACKINNHEVYHK